MDRAGTHEDTCSYCGATQTRRLGVCPVCSMSVCELCGNMQFSEGVSKPTHRECLKKDDGGFKMIKFIR